VPQLSDANSDVENLMVGAFGAVALAAAVASAWVGVSLFRKGKRGGAVVAFVFAALALLPVVGVALFFALLWLGAAWH